MASYLIGILGIVLMMVIWAVVQLQWKKTFAEEMTDEDVLAGRGDCGSCGCGIVCQNKPKIN